MPRTIVFPANGEVSHNLVRAFVNTSALIKAKEHEEAPICVVVQTQNLALNGYGQTKYHRNRIYLLSLESLNAIPKLADPNREQKEWVLSRLKQPVKYWRSFK